MWLLYPNVPDYVDIYSPTNFWGVVLFLLPTLPCSLSITGGRSKVVMGLDSLGTSPWKVKKGRGLERVGIHLSVKSWESEKVDKSEISRLNRLLLLGCENERIKSESIFFPQLLSLKKISTTTHRPFNHNSTPTNLPSPHMIGNFVFVKQLYVKNERMI